MIDCKKVHVCISGYGQSASRPDGIYDLSVRLADLGVGEVMYLEWDADFWSLAVDLLSRREHFGGLSVNIYAYSWGMGWGAMQLCR